MHGAGQVPSFNLITAEQDNLVTILRSAIDERRGGDIASVFSALAYYWSLRGAHSEVLASARSWSGRSPAGSRRTIDRTPGRRYGRDRRNLPLLDLRTAVRAISRLKRIDATEPLADPRLDALPHLVLHAGRDDPGMALLAEYAASSDPALAAIGNLMTAQFWRTPATSTGPARGDARQEKAKLAQDTWSMASAAQSIAQVHSQLAHPAEALQWAKRAQDGMAQLQAAGDLRQLDWLIAINAISSGDIARGRRLLERYLGTRWTDRFRLRRLLRDRLRRPRGDRPGRRRSAEAIRRTARAL